MKVPLFLFFLSRASFSSLLRHFLLIYANCLTRISPLKSKKKICRKIKSPFLPAAKPSGHRTVRVVVVVVVVVVGGGLL